METRQFEFRSVEQEERTVRGVAVPYNDPVDVGGYKEQIAPGAVVPRDNVMLFYGHTEPIGKVIASESTETGWEITAKISETSRGNDILTLLRDGVLTKFSIGFLPIEEEDIDGIVTRTRIDVREVSVVPIPAYEAADIKEVRSEPEARKEDVMTNVVTADELAEVREIAEEAKRAASMVRVAESPVVDNRSAGAMLQAIVAGDETAIRAYAGGTTADAVIHNGWLGDLTRIVQTAAPLSNVFSTGTLPSEGNFVEYAQLKTNTVAVADQGGEGADLTLGKVAVEAKTAAVKTFGGYSILSRQEIERASVPMLDHTLRAQAIATGNALNAYLRADYQALITAQAANKVTVASGTNFANWLGAIIDAQVKFAAQGLELESLVVTGATYKKLGSIVDANGLPVLRPAQGVGGMDVKGLSASILGIPVVMDANLAAGQDGFVNSKAIRLYKSPVVALSDDNNINLSKIFSVYTYAAVTDEIPTGVVPVTVTA